MRSDVHGRMRKQIFTTINNNIHVNVIVSRFDLFCSFPSCYRESKEPLNCGECYETAGGGLKTFPYVIYKA